MSFGRLGVAGVGLIGGSIALRARAGGADVVGYDRDDATLVRARERGVIDATANDLESLARQSETLIIALPVDATLTALEQLAGCVGPLLVMDVASVKSPLVRAGLDVPHYVGTHPMAGRERGGIDAAEAGLFAAATWAHTPPADPALRARVRAFIVAMGGVPLEIEAAQHDAIVALTSHLPQALSVMLGTELATAAAGDGRVFELCGPGMMSMLRLARSPEATWLPIVTANAGPIAQRLRLLARSIDAAAAALENGESGPLMSYFETARTAAVALEQRFAATVHS